MSLKEFKKENCSKCESKNISLLYCDGEDLEKICFCKVGTTEEHMHHYCQTCRFEWLTKVKK